MKLTSTGMRRRKLLQLSIAGAAAMGTRWAFPDMANGAEPLAASGEAASVPAVQDEAQLYAETLKTWCDGLVARQITTLADPALRGGIVCPSCGLIHGRCGDAIYPLLRMAHTTGDERYLRAALLVYEWTERTVGRRDGSWVNDVSLLTWQGITVFHTIALAEALEHHGAVLDAATQRAWKDRLRGAAKFLDGFMTIETGNINYPATSSLAFQLCGQLLDDKHFLEKAHTWAHAILGQFTTNGLLAGEGHPVTGVSAKGCRPIDLGYNVEETLPSLALYAHLAKDEEVLEHVRAAYRGHLEFMLPDGAWDNSWGTRMYKWTWWGSRTSDGCHPGLVLLSDREPVFREAARRNLELMAACTHDGLLYGGPELYAQGYSPCIHHTFTHAKAVATVLDRAKFNTGGGARPLLPREAEYGLKVIPEIGTRLAAVGPWRATVTENDWEYLPDTKLGHVSGGALSLLFHRSLGPLLTASMTEYAMIEPSNQQSYRDGSHMALTPRIEYTDGSTTYISLTDFKAQVTAESKPGEVVLDARGRLLTLSRKPPADANIEYHLTYRLSEPAVEITASVSGTPKGAVKLILPVIVRSGERVEQPNAKTVRIAKTKGTLTLTTDAENGFEGASSELTFNLVPGFAAAPLSVVLVPGKEASVKFEATA